MYLTGLNPKEVIKSLINISMKYKGLTMEQDDWKEFDFINIKGEKKAVILGGLSEITALGNYRIRTFYPFDGDVGFVGGSDYDKQKELQNIELFDKKTISQEEYDSHWPDKQETAYMFRTNDDGKSFTKIRLLKGYHVDEIIKYKQNYYTILENYLMKYKTYISKDNGKTWEIFLDNGAIELFFSDKKFIFSRFVYPKDNRDKKNDSLYHFFYTTDGGKTSSPLSKKIIKYTKYKSMFNLYKGNLLFLEDNKLVQFNIDTQEEEKISIVLPDGYKIASAKSRYFGKNPLAFGENKRYSNNVLQINKENGKPYILLQKNDTNDTIPAQISIFYPLENKHIILNKNISKIVPLKVVGKYIGGFIKKSSILVHIWTYNDGEDWKYEVLGDYYLLKGPKVAYNKIWMTALVRGERPDRKEGYPKVKGSFLIMGTVKTNKKEVSEIIPEDFTLYEPKK